MDVEHAPEQFQNSTRRRIHRELHLSDFHGPGWDHVGRYSKLLLVEEAPSLASWVVNLFPVPGGGASDDPPWRIILYFADP